MSEAGRLPENILRHTFPDTVSVTSSPGSGRTNCATLGPCDIDVPMTSAPAENRRRLRPAHDGTMQWLLDLGQFLPEEETIAEEPMLYVQTWFFLHEAHVSWRDPRPIRLEGYSMTSIDDFRHLWRDVLRHDEVFSLRVVRPKPPQARFSHYACHVITEQAGSPRGSTCVITGDRIGGMIQGAFSLPSIVRSQDVIDAIEIEVAIVASHV